MFGEHNKAEGGLIRLWNKKTKKSHDFHHVDALEALNGEQSKKTWTSVDPNAPKKKPAPKPGAGGAGSGDGGAGGDSQD